MCERLKLEWSSQCSCLYSVSSETPVIPAYLKSRLRPKPKTFLFFETESHSITLLGLQVSVDQTFLLHLRRTACLSFPELTVCATLLGQLHLSPAFYPWLLRQLGLPTDVWNLLCHIYFVVPIGMLSAMERQVGQAMLSSLYTVDT